MKPKIFSFALNTLFIAGLSLAASAQKLPDVQPKGIAAPVGIKIDGKNTEWTDGFQASNKRTNIFYTLSNDDKNLYLVIKSTDIGNNMKILAGGITFSVNPDGKRKEKESITMTYPIVRRANLRGGAGGQGGARRAMTVTAGAGGAEMSTKQRDSMMAAMQKTQLAQVKEIEIRGFKTTTDTLVSIYNEFGIKAFANIESDNSFFYEAAIPLEALGLTKDSATEFAYNIKINGLQMQGFGGGGGGGFGGGGGGRSFNMGGAAPSSRNSPIDFQALMSPTDFWGKYILIKKQ